MTPSDTPIRCQEAQAGCHSSHSHAELVAIRPKWSTVSSKITLLSKVRLSIDRSRSLRILCLGKPLDSDVPSGVLKNLRSQLLKISDHLAHRADQQFRIELSPDNLVWAVAVKREAMVAYVSDALIWDCFLDLVAEQLGPRDPILSLNINENKVVFLLLNHLQSLAERERRLNLKTLDSKNIVSQLLDQLATADVENAGGLHCPSIQNPKSSWGAVKWSVNDDGQTGESKLPQTRMRRSL